MFIEEAMILKFSVVESATAPKLRVESIVGFAPDFGRSDLALVVSESGRWPDACQLLS